MAVNPERGEVELVVNGTSHILRLTLGRLRKLQADLGVDSLDGVMERLSRSDFDAIVKALDAATDDGIDIKEIEGWTVPLTELSDKLMVAVNRAVFGSDRPPLSEVGGEEGIEAGTGESSSE